ncbi:hypothetical protein [Ligilactobacillus acidipiscis]|uniref:hypothetical protein n=1 Tax=Ligilactobacillus acidipiscis TaxID=89059 RepID=UPI0023F6708D|nr:hypothetical protein [Ligilactobacillus acidipiscis]WEV58169.1 hypothetical protein OZX66_12615 [Ligilactobacillus acidipiscis]
MAFTTKYEPKRVELGNGKIVKKIVAYNTPSPKVKKDIDDALHGELKIYSYRENEELLDALGI